MWGKRCSRNSRKQSLPLWPVQFTQKKVPPCELASAQPRNWKDPKICPAVNIVSSLNRSQTVKSLGFLPFDFLRPEWKGHSLYLLKVTKTSGRRRRCHCICCVGGETPYFYLASPLTIPSSQTLDNRACSKSCACPRSGRRCVLGAQVRPRNHALSTRDFVPAPLLPLFLSSERVTLLAGGFSLSV